MCESNLKVNISFIITLEFLLLSRNLFQYRYVNSLSVTADHEVDYFIVRKLLIISYYPTINRNVERAAILMLKVY